MFLPERERSDEAPYRERHAAASKSDASEPRNTSRLKAPGNMDEGAGMVCKLSIVCPWELVCAAAYCGAICLKASGLVENPEHCYDLAADDRFQPPFPPLSIGLVFPKRRSRCAPSR